MSADRVCDLDLRGVSEAVARGEVSSVEATEAYLRRIERHDAVLRSYITVMADRALAAARVADQEQAHGRRGGSRPGRLGLGGRLRDVLRPLGCGLRVFAGDGVRLPVPLQAKQVFQRPGTVNGTVPSLLPVPPHLRHSSPPQRGHTIVLMAACSLPERPGPAVVRAGPRLWEQGSSPARAGA